MAADRPRAILNVGVDPIAYARPLEPRPASHPASRQRVIQAAGTRGAMQFDYSKWKGPRPEDVEFVRQLMEIYRNLLLQTGGDVEEALRWMAHFGREYGFFDENFSIA